MSRGTLPAASSHGALAPFGAWVNFTGEIARRNVSFRSNFLRKISRRKNRIGQSQKIRLNGGNRLGSGDQDFNMNPIDFRIFACGRQWPCWLWAFAANLPGHKLVLDTFHYWTRHWSRHDEF
jgi:hypothetical protein